jgi:hypothetical protein
MLTRILVAEGVAAREVRLNIETSLLIPWRVSCLWPDSLSAMNRVSETFVVVDLRGFTGMVVKTIKREPTAKAFDGFMVLAPCILHVQKRKDIQ